MDNNQDKMSIFKKCKMEITHEIREYVIKDSDKRYSVRHNIRSDYYSIKEIVENEQHWDRNSMIYVEVTDDFLKKIKEVINTTNHQ